MHTIDTPFGAPGFLVLAGSRLYGIDTAESDYDYVGALVEPIEYRVGLDNYSQGSNAQHGFEQHTFKEDNYEGTVYSVWKLASMFAEGNPTSLCTLFATPLVDQYGICTDEFRKMVVSQKSGYRFLKYMEAQRKSMLAQRSKGITRTALIEAHGYDTKFAGNLIRLGFQGIEFLKYGTITLPMSSAEREVVRHVRAGEWSEASVLIFAEDLQRRMVVALERCSLPDEADWKAVSDWLVGTYEAHWRLRVS